MLSTHSEFTTADLFETEGSRADEPEAAAPGENERLAVGLERIAALLGPEERLRREALRRAATAIRGYAGSLTAQIAESGLEAVHALGINYELSGIVTDWVRSGRLRWLEQLEARRREALARVPGIGPRLASELREVFGVVDLEGLAQVAREGRLQEVYGFGPKRVKRVLDAVVGRQRLAQSRQLSLLAGSP